MSFFDDVMHLVQEGDSEIGKLGNDLKQDLESGASALDSEISTLKQELETELSSLASDFSNLVSQAESACSSYMTDIKAVANLLGSTPTVPSSAQQAYCDLVTAAKNATANNTVNTYNDLMTLYNALFPTSLVSLLSDQDTFGTIGFSAGAEGGLGLQFAGGVGFAAKTPAHDSDYRVVAETGCGAGADADLDLGAYIGLFRDAPVNRQGAFFAVRLSAEDVGGCGVTVLCKIDFSGPKVELDGIAFNLSGGEGIEVSAMLGYEMNWK